MKKIYEQRNESCEQKQMYENILQNNITKWESSKK